MANDQQGYDEYSLIWDGALDQIITVSPDGALDVAYGGNLDASTLDEWIEQIADAAQAGDDRPIVEISRTPHYHPLSFSGECECAQYVTDGTPLYTFGADEV